MALPNARLNCKVTTMNDAAELANRIEALEIQIAHQDATVEALNQALTAQWKQIDMLTRQMTRLTDRVAAAEQSIPASPSNEPPPPHY
jgi:SlyX protein